MSGQNEVWSLCRAIIRWHVTYGLQACERHEGLGDLLPAYRRFLQQYGAISVQNERAAAAIAREQIDGVLAWSGREVLPDSTWREVDAPSSLLQNPPDTLIAAATRILVLLEQLAKTPPVDDAPRVFELPEGWWQRQVPLMRHMKRIQSVCWDETETKLRNDFQQVVAGLEQHGLGGLEVLVAAHKSARHSRQDRGKEEDSQTGFYVYSPACFNFQLATGERTLVSRLVRGEVHLGRVVVGVSQGWAIEQHDRGRRDDH